MKSVEELADELETHFVLQDYKLHIDGELQTPTASDLVQVIEHAKTYISEGGIIEVARLVIIKPHEDDKYDVYIHVGTIGE